MIALLRILGYLNPDSNIYNLNCKLSLSELLKN